MTAIEATALEAGTVISKVVIDNAPAILDAISKKVSDRSSTVYHEEASLEITFDLDQIVNTQSSELSLPPDAEIKLSSKGKRLFFGAQDTQVKTWSEFITKICEHRENENAIWINDLHATLHYWIKTDWLNYTLLSLVRFKEFSTHAVRPVIKKVERKRRNTHQIEMVFLETRAPFDPSSTNRLDKLYHLLSITKLFRWKVIDRYGDIMGEKQGEGVFDLRATTSQLVTDILYVHREARLRKIAAPEIARDILGFTTKNNIFNNHINRYHKNLDDLQLFVNGSKTLTLEEVLAILSAMEDTNKYFMKRTAKQFSQEISEIPPRFNK